MRIIDADTVVTIMVFDEMYEEYNLRTMTIAEALDLWTEEGCPSSADAVQGEWNTGKPTKGGKYIVTLIGIGDYRFVDIMHYDKPCMPNKEVSGACWYRDDDEWGDVVYDDKDIIAWIPLPKPYNCGARMKGGAE